MGPAGEAAMGGWLLANRGKIAFAAVVYVRRLNLRAP
jgi:hypothetical protein